MYIFSEYLMRPYNTHLKYKKHHQARKMKHKSLLVLNGNSVNN